MLGVLVDEDEKQLPVQLWSPAIHFHGCGGK